MHEIDGQDRVFLAEADAKVYAGLAALRAGFEGQAGQHASIRTTPGAPNWRADDRPEIDRQRRLTAKEAERLLRKIG